MVGSVVGTVTGREDFATFNVAKRRKHVIRPSHTACCREHAPDAVQGDSLCKSLWRVPDPFAGHVNEFCPQI